MMPIMAHLVASGSAGQRPCSSVSNAWRMLVGVLPCGSRSSPASRRTSRSFGSPPASVVSDEEGDGDTASAATRDRSREVDERRADDADASARPLSVVTGTGVAGESDVGRGAGVGAGGVGAGATPSLKMITRATITTAMRMLKPITNSFDRLTGIASSGRDGNEEEIGASRTIRTG